MGANLQEGAKCSQPSLWKIYGIAFPVCTALALFYLSQGIWQNQMRHLPTPWHVTLIAWLIGLYHTALVTPVIFRLSQRFSFDKENWVKRCLLHGVFSLVFSALTLSSQAWLFVHLHLYPSQSSFRSFIKTLMLAGFYQNVLSYWVIVTIEFVTRYYRRFRERLEVSTRLEAQALELEALLVGAKLSALNMQLQPHFLFNTLNATMVLVRKTKVGEAAEMLRRLSQLLRCVLTDVTSQEVTLERELMYVRLYLEIEQVRFQDRLKIRIDAEPSLLGAAVPYLGLQPLVENAIRHGIDKSVRPGSVEITAARQSNWIELSVRNDGPPLSDRQSVEGHGIGLSNIRARLQSLYGDKGQLSIADHPRGGVVATIVLPYRRLDRDPGVFRSNGV